jgi:hypothetical protein
MRESRNPARPKANQSAIKDRQRSTPPSQPLLSAKSTKEKHVEDTGYEETDKKSPAKNAQGKAGRKARKEVGLIRWRAKAIQPGLWPVSSD